MKTLAIAAAALGLAVTAAPAFATPAEKMTIKVDLAGIDLNTAAGQRHADRKIEEAVRVVCRVASPTTGTRIMSQNARSCIAKARATANEQLAAMTEDERRGG